MADNKIRLADALNNATEVNSIPSNSFVPLFDKENAINMMKKISADKIGGGK